MAYRDGKIYNQTYRNGGKIIEKPRNLGDTKRTGSTIHFKPDPKIFSSTIFEYKTISQRLKESAYLIKGLRIDLNDLRTGKSESFHFQNGIVEFIKSLTVGKEALYEPVFLSGNMYKINVEAALVYCEKTYNENILSFVNNIRTRDGGTHEVGFKSAITRAFNDHARLIGALKDKDINLDGADIREGLTAIISIRVPEDLLQFDGQISANLINKAIRASKAREAAKKARDEVRMVKQKTSKPANLLGKLTPAQYKNPSKNELFLVEGDSAGGTAKQGRDRSFQAVLPLRGKVLNTAKTKIEEVLKNEEIMSIINAVGAGFGADFDYTKSNYNKVIIMTDADTDGAHIQILLMTFFYRYMKGLVENGMVYIATPPLYKITYKNVVEYAWSDEELREKIQKKNAQIQRYKGLGEMNERQLWTDGELAEVIDKDGKGYMLQRYKGLGEMNAEQLWETTMDPARRSLIQINIGEEGDVENKINILMGDDPEPRREWIENNVVFDSDDNFILEGDDEDE